MPTSDRDLHLAVIELFDGGVINNANIALKVANLVQESLGHGNEASARLPINITDRGDSWSVPLSGWVGADGGVVRRLEIRKRDAAIVPAEGPFARDLLGDAAIAEKFAAAILENAAGTAALGRQAPLTVEDRGETWRIRGSANADRASEGPGPFELEVKKRDARVLDMKFEWVLETPPDVLEMLRASGVEPGRFGGRTPDRGEE